MGCLHSHIHGDETTGTATANLASKPLLIPGLVQDPINWVIFYCDDSFRVDAI